jgi:hypothetical protein
MIALIPYPCEYSAFKKPILIELIKEIPTIIAIGIK